MVATRRDVVAVIGAGPAGLAAAATLKPLGVRVRVLEQADSIGARWRDHYERLHLHTTRTLSALPGLAIPAKYGRWVSRDDFVRYQQAYATHHGLEPELGTTVERIERLDDRWHVTTSNGPIDAQYVVVGMGYNNVAFLPQWPGHETFTTELVHSHRYRNGEKYKGQHVLVVGTGNTGAEIATDLAEQGADVWWSFRTPPNILPRTVAGIAMQAFGIVLRALPVKLVDAIGSGIGRIVIGDLQKYGLPRATRGAYTAVLNDHVLPILDVGLVHVIKTGRVKPVPTIASFDGPSVVLADGQRLTPDAVIACTGFRPALEPVVGHLGVLDGDGIPTIHGATEHANAPGIFFIGYTNAISGNLREIANQARDIAARIRAARSAREGPAALPAGPAGGTPD